MTAEMFKIPILANLPLDNEQIIITHQGICPLFDAGKNRTFDKQEVRYLWSCGLMDGLSVGYHSQTSHMAERKLILTVTQTIPLHVRKLKLKRGQ